MLKSLHGCVVVNPSQERVKLNISVPAPRMLDECDYPVMKHYIKLTCDIDKEEVNSSPLSSVAPSMVIYGATTIKAESSAAKRKLEVVDDDEDDDDVGISSFSSGISTSSVTSAKASLRKK